MSLNAVTLINKGHRVSRGYFITGKVHAAVGAQDTGSIVETICGRTGMVGENYGDDAESRILNAMHPSHTCSRCRTLLTR